MIDWTTHSHSAWRLFKISYRNKKKGLKVTVEDQMTLWSMIMKVDKQDGNMVNMSNSERIRDFGNRQTDGQTKDIRFSCFCN